ncbi:alpha/beta hydrolase [Kocuria sp. WRN011]|uniref:alpha/beta fold hydrolase n=1 Tax=Kocuria sp. WRN011 TaxID=2029858 RepID=UPI000BB0ACB3|nr:alpha/beta fold hydrolase [Kocuria sp. WRN011]PBB09324.1 alpha/beta hydrolase [Kocuria sp. WRN011]
MLTPAATQERYVETSVGSLGVLRAGPAVSGRLPLLLIHGGGTDCSAISWYRLFEPLSTDRQAWAVDLPGFGRSMFVDPVGSPADMADLLAEVLRVLGIDSAIVCGVSMGGDAALNLALSHAPLVAGMILVAPGGLTPALKSPWAQRAAWYASRLPDAMLLPLGRFANRFVRASLNSMVKDPATLPEPVVEEFVRLAREPRGTLGYTRYNQATIGRDRMLNDLSDRVAEIDAPALFFHGAEDPLVDPEGSRRATAAMPDARLVMVPNCGHWAQVEQHDRFMAEAVHFLMEVDGLN